MKTSSILLSWRIFLNYNELIPEMLEMYINFSGLSFAVKALVKALIMYYLFLLGRYYFTALLPRFESFQVDQLRVVLEILLVKFSVFHFMSSHKASRFIYEMTIFWLCTIFNESSMNIATRVKCLL